MASTEIEQGRVEGGMEEVAAVTARRWRSSPLVHVLLFVATFFSIAFACSAFVLTSAVVGTVDADADLLAVQLSHWYLGIPYALLMLLFLSAHEFGHYF